MSCKTHFYKFDPDNTKFELLNNSGQYVEPNINDNVVFDTGNASHTFITYKFIEYREYKDYSEGELVKLKDYDKISL